RADLWAADRDELERQLGRLAEAAAIRRLLAARLRDPSATRAERLSCLAAMSHSGLKPKQVPGEWVEAMGIVLGGGESGPARDEAELAPAVVAAARSLPIAPGGDKVRDLADRLLRGRTNAAHPPRPRPPPPTPRGLRPGARAAGPDGLVRPDAKLFEFLLEQIHPDRPVAARTTAADILARARLAPGQLDRLAEALAAAGPVEADRLLAAFEQ